MTSVPVPLVPVPLDVACEHTEPRPAPPTEEPSFVVSPHPSSPFLSWQSLLWIQAARQL